MPAPSVPIHNAPSRPGSPSASLGPATRPAVRPSGPFWSGRSTSQRRWCRPTGRLTIFPQRCYPVGRKAAAAIECHGVPGLGSEFRSSLSTRDAGLVPSPMQQKEALARIPSRQLAGFGFDKASHRRSAPGRRTQVLDQVRPSPLAQTAAARHHNPRPRWRRSRGRRPRRLPAVRRASDVRLRVVTTGHRAQPR